ncbi:MAG TPA: hypothetical protein VN039_13570 [Nitrospira sp.]|nr:hypothetical protein [Nitrospira sp.]
MEPFDEAVRRGFAWLDVAQLDASSVRPPGDQPISKQFGAIVEPNCLGEPRHATTWT